MIKLNINKKQIERLRRFSTVRIDEPMRNYTTFSTGGPADVFVCPYTKDSVKEIVSIAWNESIPYTIIGGGSNILVGNKGIRGILIRLCEDFEIKGEIRIEDDDTIYVDSIKKKEAFMLFCLNHGYMGMEFMTGIPGCIGGGIIMNAGTVYGSFVDILKKILYINNSGNIDTMVVTDEMARYRRLDIDNGLIVLGGFFKLFKTDNISGVKDKINKIQEERRLKHPLDYPSAGSVFKNPEGYSAWKLIDEAGLKGKRIGGAVVSDLHTNFIINVDNATSSDVLNLINYIKERVLSRFNILLKTEIEILGEF